MTPSEFFFELFLYIAVHLNIFIILLLIHLNAVSKDDYKLFRGISLSITPTILSALFVFVTVDYYWHENFQNLLNMLLNLLIILIFVSISIFSSIMLMRENSPDANK